jgi:protein-S-isoprenylcysteine O-methyltransferase Ste14
MLALRSGLLLLGVGRPRRGPRPAFVLAGPYVRVRNPLLVGVLLACAGLSLALASWPAGAVTLGVALGAHLWVVGLEEPRLRRRFGRAYAEYLRCVPRWLPALGRRRLPDI